MTQVAAICLAVVVIAAPAFAQGAPPGAGAPASEIIAEIQVHGNNVTPDAEVLAIAGVNPGDAFDATTLDVVRARLMAGKRFEGVDLRKRFASISDPSQVALVIVVDEFPVSVRPAAPGNAEPRVVGRRLLGGVMFLPILEGEDGYGLTYGLVTTVPNVAAERSRLSFPVSWGGRKRAAVEFEQRFPRGPLSRAVGVVEINRGTNPAFQEEDTRQRVSGRVEHALARVVAGANATRERVTFGTLEEQWTSVGADVVFDTRLDPALPRDALYVALAWTHLVGDVSGSVNRTRVDVRGFVGLVRQVVLVVRAERESADARLPPYFKPLLGGWSNLRGYRAGAFAGDSRMNGTLELRVPLSRRLSVLKAGVSAFVDAGKAYDRGVSFADVPYARGVGVGAWFTATILHGSIDVARSRGGGVRVNAGVGMTF